MVSEVMEPHLFVMRKQKRDGPEKVTPMLTYYVLDGSIYQAPQLCNVFAARVVCSQLPLFLFYFFVIHESLIICLCPIFTYRGELCIIYQRLLLLQPQSWRRLGMVS